MKLSLSSAALPDGSLADLARRTHQRNLEGLEIVIAAGHSHGIEASCELGSTGSCQELSGHEDVPVQWLLVDKEVSPAEALHWGRRAHLLRAGLILSEAVSESPVGVPTALRHPTDPAAAQRACAWAQLHDAQTCWDVDVTRAEAEGIDDVLEVTASHLGHVRLRGAGPESQSAGSEGMNLGDVLKALTLRGYDGTVALAPSATGRQEEWRDWLFEKRGWGCNTAAKKRASK